MGTYTYYSLTVQDASPARTCEIVEDLRSRFEEAALALKEDGSCWDEATWYDCELHVCIVSSHFPDEFLELHGTPCIKSEGQPWTKVFRDGDVVDFF